MDPFTLCLIFSALIVKLIKVDSQYAKRGETPPGVGLIGKWLEGRRANGGAPAGTRPAKYGMWRYFWQRWAALWEVLAEGHKIKHQQYLDARKQALLDGTPKPTRPSLKEQIATGWRWVIDPRGGEPADAAGSAPAEAGQPTTPEPGSSPDGPVITCDECGNTLIDGEGGWEHPGRAFCSKAEPAASTRERHNPGAQAEPAPARPAVQPDASEPTEGDPMPTTQVSGEVTGIPSAVHYLERMAQVHRSHADNEALVTALAGFRVGEGDLGLVREAMMRSAEAAELYDSAATQLEENNRGVREAYGSSAEAADKYAQVAE